jgi:predicted nuclease of predicted toxin-antitoxin system
MKFLLDAQLPRRLVFVFRNPGYDAIHTLDLPQQNTTSDSDITNIAIQETRIVVTKDADFVESFILSRRPPRLLVIATGNIPNAALESLLLAALPAITAAFTTHRYLELTRQALIIHT